MIKIISPKNNVTEIKESIIEVDDGFSLIKEILRKNDCSQYSIIIGDEEKISLKDTFQLQLNVKQVGTFHFIFNNKEFKKEQIAKELSGLKDLNVDNVESAKYKVAALINIIKNYNPLFAVYKESNDTFYYSYELEGLTNHLFPVFIVKVQQLDIMYEFSIGEDHHDELVSTYDKKNRVSNFRKDKILKEIARNRFTLLLIFVSTILIQISYPLAILNIYSKNALYVFLFICGTIGFVMNTYCYVDYFKNRDIKNPLFICCVIANVIGIGVGIAGFALFYNISTKPENAPGLGSFILLGSLICMVVIAAAIAIIYFIPRKNKAK